MREPPQLLVWNKLVVVVLESQGAGAPTQLHVSDTQGWAEIIDYTERTADHHARLIAHVKRTGRPQGALDLIIAAHALETGRILISRDAAARDGDLPGVVAEES